MDDELLDLPKDFPATQKEIAKEDSYDDLKRVKTFSNQKSRGSLGGID
jgi:hypothetical protein